MASPPRFRHHPSFARPPHRRPRRGIAAVELAVCLPLLAVAIFGTLEACRAIYIRQDLTLVAYEGARIGIIPGSTKEAIATQCSMMLDDRGITGYTIESTPDPANLSPGQMLQVSVTADCDSNITVSNFFFKDKEVTEQVTMRVE